MSHLRRIAQPPDLGAISDVSTGRQPFAVRADGDMPAVVERAHVERPLGGRDEGKPDGRPGHDPARPIRRRFPRNCRRQRELLRRTDAEFTPVRFEPNRPMLHAARHCS